VINVSADKGIAEEDKIRVVDEGETK